MIFRSYGQWSARMLTFALLNTSAKLWSCSRMLSRLLRSGVAAADRPVTSGTTVSRRKTSAFSNLHAQANSAGVRRVNLGVFSDLPGAGMAGAGGTRIGLGALEVATAAGVMVVAGVAKMGSQGVLRNVTLAFLQSISGLYWLSQRCLSTIIQ